MYAIQTNSTLTIGGAKTAKTAQVTAQAKKIGFILYFTLLCRRGLLTAWEITSLTLFSPYSIKRYGGGVRALLLALV